MADPFRIWDELRGQLPGRPHRRRGSTWLPTRYQDVVDLAHDIGHFSSGEITVIPSTSRRRRDERVLQYGVPPISADPPLHTWTRRLLLPWFSHRRVEGYEPMTRTLCAELVDGFIAQGSADAARDYAQQIPVRVIAAILGVPSSLSDTFTGWVRDVLEFADDRELRTRGIEGLIGFFVEEVAKAQARPGRRPVERPPAQRGRRGAGGGQRGARGGRPGAHCRGRHHLECHRLVPLAPGHPSRGPQRLVADPDVMPLAVEEFLRAYSPVTMARVVTEDVEFEGCPMKAGDKVLMNFPAANRDPEAFEDADQVVLDRRAQPARGLRFGHPPVCGL